MISYPYFTHMIISSLKQIDTISYCTYENPDACQIVIVYGHVISLYNYVLSIPLFLQVMPLQFLHAIVQCRLCLKQLH